MAATAEDERADVEESFRSVTGDEGGVARYGELYAREKMGGRDRRDGDVGGGVGEAGGVDVGAENVDLFIGSTKG